MAPPHLRGTWAECCACMGRRAVGNAPARALPAASRAPPQVSSEVATAPAVKLARAGRDAVLKQALSKPMEQVLAASVLRLVAGLRLAAGARLGGWQGVLRLAAGYRPAFCG